MESAAARVCREAGARVSLNILVQDIDLARPHDLDNRRLETVVDGLPLFMGAQWAVDTAIVSVPNEARWFRTRELCQRRRRIFGGSPSAPGNHLPRTDRTQRVDKACRPRLRGWWALVWRGSGVPPRLGQSHGKK